ncbi:MAG: hypothetical protein FWE62_04480 [Firmicutes bacterium]|nr:hypothetical protein [Bacillota bacterium]
MVYDIADDTEFFNALKLARAGTDFRTRCLDAAGVLSGGGQFTHAADEYKKLLAYNPHDYSLFADIAYQYFLAGDYFTSESYINIYESVNTKIFMTEGPSDSKAPVALVGKCIAPDGDDALINIAKNLIEHENYADALSVLGYVSNARAPLLRGICLYQTGDYKNARDELKRAAAEPQEPATTAYLALVDKKSGGKQYRKLIGRLLAMIHKKNFPDAHIARICASVLIECEEHAEALSVLGQIARFYARDCRSARFVARAYALLGYPELSVSCTNRAELISPSDDGPEPKRGAQNEDEDYRIRSFLLSDADTLRKSTALKAWLFKIKYDTAVTFCINEQPMFFKWEPSKNPFRKRAYVNAAAALLLTDKNFFEKLDGFFFRASYDNGLSAVSDNSLAAAAYGAVTETTGLSAALLSEIFFAEPAEVSKYLKIYKEV